MPSLRAIRLLNAVEAGTHSASDLQTSLTDPGRLVDFKILLSMRGQARRMAASETTVLAIANSQLARDAVFKEASATNSITNQAILGNATAVGIVSNNLQSLIEIEANSVTWDQWTTSTYYEVNSKDIIQTLAGTANFDTIELLIANVTANNLVVESRAAMRAVVASPATVGLVTASTSMMSDIVGSPVSMSIIANNAAAMSSVAGSGVAMTQVIASANAMNLISNSYGGMGAVYANNTAWTSFKTSSHFATNIVAIVSKLAGITEAFASLDSLGIAGNDAALTAVSNNAGASETFATNVDALRNLATHANLYLVANNDIIMNAIAADDTAMVSLATHANFSVVASNAGFMAGFANNSAATTALKSHSNFAVAAANSVAIGALVNSQAAMTSYLGDNTTLAAIFASSGGRGAIFASNVAISTIASTPSALTYLKANGSKTTFSTTVPNAAGSAGAFVPFGGGVSSKVLVFNVRQAGIAAIPTAYQLATGIAGDPAVVGVEFNAIGVAALAADQYPQEHVATYENLTVKSAAAIIAITGVLGIRYYDMT